MDSCRRNDAYGRRAPGSRIGEIPVAGAVIAVAVNAERRGGALEVAKAFEAFRVEHEEDTARIRVAEHEEDGERSEPSCLMVLMDWKA